MEKVCISAGQNGLDWDPRAQMFWFGVWAISVPVRARLVIAMYFLSMQKQASHN